PVSGGSKENLTVEPGPWITGEKTPTPEICDREGEFYDRRGTYCDRRSVHCAGADRIITGSATDRRPMGDAWCIALRVVADYKPLDFWRMTCGGVLAVCGRVGDLFDHAIEEPWNRQLTTPFGGDRQLFPASWKLAATGKFLFRGWGGGALGIGRGERDVRCD